MECRVPCDAQKLSRLYRADIAVVEQVLEVTAHLWVVEDGLLHHEYAIDARDAVEKMHLRAVKAATVRWGKDQEGQS